MFALIYMFATIPIANGQGQLFNMSVLSKYLVHILLAFSLFSTGILTIACPPYNTNITNFPQTRYPPDPFTFLNGDNVISKADWQCRRTELASLLQDIELGYLPPKSTGLTAKLSDDNVLTIDVEENGRSISFSATIQYPGQTRPNNPIPAIIAYGTLGFSLGDFNIAQIIYNNVQITSPNAAGNRGRGKFYDLYGPEHSAGALIAWTWGLSRIIDALELLGPNATGINTRRLGLTGCSRNAGGVLVAGAFEPRIALTIPRESGAGGTACWRFYEDKYCQGTNICDYGLTPWNEPYLRYGFPYTYPLDGFENLPYDHHELIGLIAPRGLLILDNDVEAREPVGSAACSIAGREVYKALGAGRAMGYSLRGRHTNCQVTQEQRPDLDLFLERFLLGRDAGSEVWSSSVDTRNYTLWSWETPVLN